MIAFRYPVSGFSKGIAMRYHFINAVPQALLIS